MSNDNKINVWGARVHNLKNIDVEIPRNSLTVITGLSGSGKSSLAFDTIFAEGQRRYIETFSAYARNFLGNMERPDVDKITGLSPVISIEQKTTNKNPRSTVGTTTEVYDYMRLLFARAGKAYSYETGEPMVKYTEEKVIEMITQDYVGRKILILAPLVRSRKGHYRELFDGLRRKGYLHVRVDGEVLELPRSGRLQPISEASGEMDHIICYSDLDYNNHCNSCKYLEWMLNTYPMDVHETPFRLDINYVKETYIGHLLKTKYLLTPDGVQYQQVDEYGNTNATCRISV